MADRRDKVDGRRYTLMWVPQGGRGTVRQWTLTLRHVRWAVVVATLLVSLSVVGVGIMGFSLPQAQTCDSLLEENLSLKSRLQDIERTLSEVEDQLRRLRMYDQQLDQLTRQGFNGYGPVESDEAEGFELAAEDDLVDHDLDAATGQLGEPMHELRGMELAAADLTPIEAWTLEVQGRAERLLELANIIEPQVGVLVESAEDERARRSAYPTTWPVEGHFTSGYGYRRSPFTRIWKFHSGIDISAPRGTKVRAGASGVVATAEYQGGYGKLVEIDHGYEVKSRYAHNAQLFVRPGDVVQAGQVIATVGTTGQSTGPHLHFEVVVNDQKVNPMAYLARRKRPRRANRASSADR